MFWKNLLATSAKTVLAAAVGGAATSSGVQSTWYAQLEKPDFQPPPVAFPIAWTLLYADIAVTSASVLTELQDQGRVGSADADRAARHYRAALTVNLVLNAGWCWTFFARRDPALATVTAAALTVSSADLARRAGRAGKPQSLALVPYAAWCGFATALSGRIHQLNS